MFFFRNQFFSIALILLMPFCVYAQKEIELPIDQRVDDLLSKMTLEEKIGQMNQYNGFWNVTGPSPIEGNAKEKYDHLSKGWVGSMLNVRGAKEVRAVQEIAVNESRLGIPLIIGFDLIHGYKTISPIPLAESASWDLSAIKKSAALGAKEAASAGINWTFAPMVDITRDARWGRVMEGAGEDPYLGSLISAARVHGFQGIDLSDPNTVAACAKHFAAYGFAESGRDYNTVDIGENTLHNIVLPPFKAASDAGVKTFMNSFNDLNGIPATADKNLHRTILKESWGFDGFIVSDWGSLKEMIDHGYAKDENHAIGATFFFNIMHYALRPWPWILVALASLVVFPDLESIQNAFPNITPDKLGNDLAYPAMLTKLPTGLLGLVLASLISAYMSTISTQLNWGSSYIVYDFYQTQINPNASQKRLVAVGRISTVLLMVLSALLALLLQNAMQLFNLLLVFGAGTGLIFILRWFWWRINAWSEITAMVVSGLISLILTIPSVKISLFGIDGLMPGWAEFPFVVAVTTSLWLLATYITPAEDQSVLRSFYKKIQPGGPGWTKVVSEAKKESIELIDDKEGWSVPSGIIAMLLGCVMIYSIMFCTGYFIYGDYILAYPLVAISLISAFFLIKIWKKVKVNVL